MVLFPALVFYVVLFRESVNLPEMDDYDAILGFVNTFLKIGTGRARLEFFLASEHVQYKLYFEHALILAEWKLTGHLNFFFLQQLGNLFVVLIVLILWRMFQPNRESLADRLILFAPVGLLLFAPRYSETLNWAMGSLQNLTVIFFAMLCFYLLARQSGGRSFAGASLCMTLAICCSGNGFLVSGIGLLALLGRRAWVRTGIWLAITGCMAGVYAFHYALNRVPPPAGPHHPLLVVCLFPFAFLGAAGGRLWLSLLLAASIVWFAGVLVRERWRVRAASTFYSCLFILITGVGVDLTRHNLGLHAALALRYAIYSQMLLALLYMTALQLGLDRKLTPRRRHLALSAVFLATTGYFGWNEAMGLRVMSRRSALIRQHYVGWMSAPERESLIPDEEPGMKAVGMREFSRRAERTLLESKELGVYEPPAHLP